VDIAAGGARTRKKRKSIARRSQRPQRGEMGFGELPYSVTPELLQLLTPVKSPRGHRGHRGGIWGFGELPNSVTPELLQLLTPVKSPRGHRGHREGKWVLVSSLIL
jgi:hypothetical protein